MTTFTDVTKEQLQKLFQKGFCQLQPKTIYEEFRCQKDGVMLVFYSSGKLLLQGKKEEVAAVEDILEKHHVGRREAVQQFRKEEGWAIGSDESLKGDTFGGIVVAAVKVDDALRQALMELGVADSKLLQDKEIIPLAEKIKKLVPCEVRSILPEEYNQHKGNVTTLLNHLHAACAKSLGEGKHIVDRYPGCGVGDIAEEKAESKYVEVAAASVLARAKALEQLDFLSAEAGFSLPKGSSHVSFALQELQERGLPFEKFVKLHFRNVLEFLEK